MATISSVPQAPQLEPVQPSSLGAVKVAFAAMITSIALAALYASKLAATLPAIHFGAGIGALSGLVLAIFLLYTTYTNPLAQFNRAVKSKNWDALPEIFRAEPRLFANQFEGEDWRYNALTYLIYKGASAETIEQIYHACAPEGSASLSDFNEEFLDALKDGQSLIDVLNRSEGDKLLEFTQSLTSQEEV